MDGWMDLKAVLKDCLQQSKRMFLEGWIKGFKNCLKDCLSVIKKHVPGWMDGWIDERKSHFKDCLQKSKRSKETVAAIVYNKNQI